MLGMENFFQILLIDTFEQDGQGRFSYCKDNRDLKAAFNAWLV
jgi:hypothetical protein